MHSHYNDMTDQAKQLNENKPIMDIFNKEMAKYKRQCKNIACHLKERKSYFEIKSPVRQDTDMCVRNVNANVNADIDF